MKYDEMLDWLYSLKTMGIMPGLDKIRETMEKLGNPQDKMKIIHVAGTNGKGSVCAMIESILRHSGYKVGMFTSPHLVEFTERFQINRKQISKEDACTLVQKVKDTGVALTFFEITAAVAFLYFAEKDTDFVVLEVGMGGRLDATNIVNPVATVITSVSFDHMNWLGNTLDEISEEKAGIVKQGVPMFSAENKVIRSVCAKKNAPFIVVDEESTNMLGSFQKKNAGLAAAVCRYMGMTENKIKEGLMHTYWPARLEFIEKNVLLDCGHNADGIRKISDFIRSLRYRRLIIIFGVMKDKQYEEMLMSLPEYFKIILTKPKIDRSLDPGAIKARDSIVIGDVEKAYEYAKKTASPDDLILVCGSCYLAGEFLALKNHVEIHPVMFIQ